MCQAIFNVIFKNAFRATHLKQIGRDPKFFDCDRPIINDDLNAMRLQVLRGYKASVFMSELGITVAFDTLFRFMSTITCLEKIRELERRAPSKDKFKEMIDKEVVGSSIIADWGNKRTYIIDGIDFTTNPVKCKFPYNGEQISVAQYMQQVYNKAVTDFNQPLIIVKHGDEHIHLPPEFCRIDGVPESIRASPSMRDCLAICRLTPEEKMREVLQCMSLVSQQQPLRDWNMTIESNPIELRNRTILPSPQIFK